MDNPQHHTALRYGTLVTLVVALAGCVAGSSRTSPWSFVRAEITRSANGGDETATIDDSELVDLLAFLPHVGEGRKSIGASMWKGGPVIRLYRRDGRIEKVWINPWFHSWQDATGEWPLDPTFAQFLDGLAWHKRPPADASAP